MGKYDFQVPAPTSTANYKPSYTSPTTLETKHTTEYVEKFSEVYTEKPNDRYPDLTTSRPEKDELTTARPYDVKKPTTPGYEGQTAPFIDSGYEKIPESETSKPPGFDQIIYNLFNDSRNKSQFVVQLTDSLGIYQNKIDNHRYQEKAVKLE